jgi:hypothetical protein
MNFSFGFAFSYSGAKLINSALRCQTSCEKVGPLGNHFNFY